MPEYNMTNENSLVQVLYNEEWLIIDFPYDPAYVSLIRQVSGAEWNTRMEKRWTVPKESYRELVHLFGGKIIWKTPDELKQSADQLTEKEETLEDVLARIPKKIETPFMKIDPYDFQKLMVAWGITRKGKKGNIYGGLLGDLMGLGKTIQALAFSGYLKAQPLPDTQPVKKVLIICPATLKMQWGQEIERFTHEKYMIIDGGKGKSASQKRIGQYKQVKDEQIFYTIVNYELLYQKERLGKMQSKKGWKKETKTVWGDYIDLSCILENEYDMVIIDEAQRMRNPETETFKAINEIQSPHIRLLMTGTPIEKDLQNLFPLMDYLSPNILASDQYDFETRYKMFQDKFLIMGWNQFALQKRNARIPEVKGVKNVGTLKKIVTPYMLRRTTEDVSDEMPEASEGLVVVDWEKTQLELYDLFKENIMKAQEDLGRANTEEEKQQAENELNETLMHMLSICDTPELLFKSSSMLAIHKISKIKRFEPFAKEMKKIVRDMNKLQREMKEKKEQAAGLREDVKNRVGEENVTQHALAELKKEMALITSEAAKLLTMRETLLEKFQFMPPKLERLLEMVYDIAAENDEKVVIFSKFERMTAILQRELDKKLNVKGKKRRADQTGIVMYTGKTDKGCQWKEQHVKEGKETEGALPCGSCPFLHKCNSRTKSAWFFQNDEKTKVIICTDAANYGVNLQSGKYLINYDLPDSFSVYSQRKGRIRRLGSSHQNVYVYNLVTSNGIDEKKYYKLMNQKEIIDQVVEKDELEENAVIRATASMERELINELRKEMKKRK